jgi:putative ABC transport system substrate-binding protein
LSGKRLQVIKEILPGASRIAVLGDPGINAPQIRELERVARLLLVQAQAVQAVNGPTDLEDAFEKAKTWRADALVLSNPLNLAYRTRIADLAKTVGLPTMYLYQAHVRAGGHFGSVAAMSANDPWLTWQRFR